MLLFFFFYCGLKDSTEIAQGVPGRLSSKDNVRLELRSYPYYQLRIMPAMGKYAPFQLMKTCNTTFSFFFFPFLFPFSFGSFHCLTSVHNRRRGGEGSYCVSVSPWKALGQIEAGNKVAFLCGSASLTVIYLVVFVKHECRRDVRTMPGFRISRV